MTRTEAALTAVKAELEHWRLALDRLPELRSLCLEAKFTPTGEVRCVIVSVEGSGGDRIKKA